MSEEWPEAPTQVPWEQAGTVDSTGKVLEGFSEEVMSDLGFAA